MIKQENTKSNTKAIRKKQTNKRGYSTEGSTLLPSVLRPRLFGAVGIATLVAGACIIGGFNSSVDNAYATVQATLTIPDNISVDVNPNENSGFAEGSVGQVEMSTNNQAGYTLSIRAKDGTELRNGNNVLNSITTNLSADEYRNGSQGNDYLNTWGFKSDVLNSKVNTSFIPSPSANGILLAETNVSSVVPDTFNLAIATKVDKSIAAGNYTNSFILTGTGKEATYNIKFDNNGGTGGPEGPLVGEIGEKLEVQIGDLTPTMEGKDFLGWCSRKPREDGTCTGVIVQPEGCFPLCKCDLNITLYAMWGTKTGGAGGGGGANYYGISNSTPCEYYGQQGTVYTGLCWMNSDYKISRTWTQATGDCPAGWHLPTQAEFNALISDGGLGSGSGLYNAGWKSTVYWSATPYSTIAYNLYITSSNAIVDANGGDGSPNYGGISRRYSVRCVAG